MALISCSGLICVFLVPVLESAISPRSTDTFYGRMVREAKMWTLGVPVAAGLSHSSRSSQLTEKETYGYILTVCIHC